MKNLLRNLMGIGLALLIVFTALPAHGQSTGCPGGADCSDAADFDAGLDSWTAELVTATWMPNSIIGLTQASGVVKLSNYQQRDPVHNAPGLWRTIYLQPGQYVLKLRAGQDPNWYTGIGVEVNSPDVVAHTWKSNLTWYMFSDYTTDSFTLYSPQQVRIRVVSDVDAYLDYIYIERLPDTEPPATEIGPTVTPGGPTLTPRPTYVPTNQQATPMPPGTAVCQAAPPLGLPAYLTPTATSTVTLQIVDEFSSGPVQPSTLPWHRVGNVTISNSAADHSGNRSGAAVLQYDPHWGETTMADWTHALVLPLDYGYEVNVSAWAQADVVLVGGSARMELWEQVGGVWAIVSTTSISSQYWYPMQGTVSASATALAFVASRSDGPSGGSAYLDDVYLYAPASALPYCGGGYPPGTVGYHDTSGSYGADIQYPADKPCPANILQPNNFWGMLLAQLTLFFDKQMAMAPAHAVGTTRDLAQQFMLGPVGGLVLLATIILDWYIPIIMLEVYIAFQVGLGVIGIWKLIRRAFIV